MVLLYRFLPCQWNKLLSTGVRPLLPSLSPALGAGETRTPVLQPCSLQRFVCVLQPGWSFDLSFDRRMLAA